MVLSQYNSDPPMRYFMMTEEEKVLRDEYLNSLNEWIYNDYKKNLDITEIFESLKDWFSFTAESSAPQRN